MPDANLAFEAILAGLPQANANAGSGRIEGMVVDKQGKPLSGMYVTSGEMFSIGFPRADTDAEGRFVADRLSPGRYKLMALPAQSSGSNVDSGIHRITLTDGQTITGVRIVYAGASERTISGLVSDTKGEPVRGASVYVEEGAHSLHARTESDGEGRYLLDLRAGLQCAVNVTHPDYSGQWFVYSHVGNNDLNFILEGRGTIQGRVVDALTRAPITHFEAGSGVRYSDKAAFLGAISMNYTAFENEDGRFSLASVDVGRVNVYVRAAGYAPVRLEIPEVEGDTVTEVGEFRLVAGASIEGTVVDTEGAPVSGAQIRLGGPRDRAMYPHKGRSTGDMIDATADREGKFHMDSLDSAFTEITASHPAYPETPAPLTLVPGKVTPVRMVMTGLATVEGMVYANGEPAVRGGVLVYAESLKVPRSGKIEENGHYRVTDVPGGPVSVRATVHVNGALRSVSAEAVATLGYATVVDLEVFSGTSTIEGMVTREGEPLGRVSVGVNEVDGDDHGSAITTPDGGYRVSGLHGGTYRVSVVDTMVAIPVLLGRAEASVAAGETTVLDIAAEESPVELKVE